jgi:hypothetical protein
MITVILYKSIKYVLSKPNVLAKILNNISTVRPPQTTKSCPLNKKFVKNGAVVNFILIKERINYKLIINYLPVAVFFSF